MSSKSSSSEKRSPGSKKQEVPADGDEQHCGFTTTNPLAKSPNEVVVSGSTAYTHDEDHFKGVTALGTAIDIYGENLSQEVIGSGSDANILSRDFTEGLPATGPDINNLGTAPTESIADSKPPVDILDRDPESAPVAGTALGIRGEGCTEGITISGTATDIRGNDPTKGLTSPGTVADIPGEYPNEGAVVSGSAINIVDKNLTEGRNAAGATIDIPGTDPTEGVSRSAADILDRDLAGRVPAAGPAINNHGTAPTEGVAGSRSTPHILDRDPESAPVTGTALGIRGEDLTEGVTTVGRTVDHRGEDPIGNLNATQTADDFLNEDPTDGLTITKTAGDLLDENPTVKLATDFLDEDPTAGHFLDDELLPTEANRHLLGEEIITPRVATGVTKVLDGHELFLTEAGGHLFNEELPNCNLADGSATLPTVGDPGLTTPNRIGAPASTKAHRESSPPSSETSSLRILEYPNWAKLRNKFWAAIKVAGPILGVLSMIQSDRLSQQARQLQKSGHEQRRYEHQRIIANQRENRQRLERIERQIEAPDKERYATIVERRSAVRLSPDSQAAIKTRLRPDIQVEPITIDDGWVRIRYIADGEERHGWVGAKYLDTVEMEE